MNCGKRSYRAGRTIAVLVNFYNAVWVKVALPANDMISGFFFSIDQRPPGRRSRMSVCSKRYKMARKFPSIRNSMKIPRCNQQVQPKPKRKLGIPTCSLPQLTVVLRQKLSHWCTIVVKPLEQTLSQDQGLTWIITNRWTRTKVNLICVKTKMGDPML